ncbi:hypothetical protein G3M55_46180, partial [Streptomyces sp. SID8455]|nr:hypothetical protein [Streptomyces sp. SID8455]
MTATHTRPEAGAGGSSAVGSASGARSGSHERRAPGRQAGQAGQGLRDVLALVLLPVPLLVAALPAAFAGGGTRRWFGGRG